jgi:hypothetical protein
VTNISIRGDGVAAYCCAHLLRMAGFRVSLRRTDRPRLPAILLSDGALALIREVFELPDTFRDAPRILRRKVAWGKAAGDSDDEPLVLEHSAVVVSEQSLLARLGQNLQVDESPAESETDWTIFASQPLPEFARERHFGSRIASAVQVDLREGCDSSACWIEFLEDGWLFLIPNAIDAGWLLAVGSPVEQLLDGSRFVAREIEGFRTAGKFPAYPRIATTLCGSGLAQSGTMRGWLACGTAAMAFDPICGDGTAHAVREAILAAAVIRAIDGGGDSAELFAHYEARLTAGFQRHLGLCREFYRTGHGGSWWDAELKSLERGLEELFRIAGRPDFRYQLNGFELKRLGPI